MTLHDISVSSLPHTASRSIKRLQSLGIQTMHDLLHYFPFRYEDYSLVASIGNIGQHILREFNEYEGNSDLVSRGKFSMIGKVTKFSNVNTRRGITVQKITLEDNTGKIVLTLFNQHYLRSTLSIGTQVCVSGHAKIKEGRVNFQLEDYEIVDPDDTSGIHTQRLVPVYHQTKGISSKTIRQKIMYVLQNHEDLIEDVLPDSIVKSGKLMETRLAYKEVHYPTDIHSLNAARFRLALDEMFTIQLTSHLIKQEWHDNKTPFSLQIDKYKKTIKSFHAAQPYKLTKAQIRSTEEILLSLSQNTPMNRLLQGDVGSGKTIVAATAMYAAWLNDTSSLFMAPTEILAQQHFISLQNSFSHLKEQDRPHLVLVTSQNKPEKKQLTKSSIVVGTHALLHLKEDIPRVSCVIIDEQHKFGVAQRSQLQQKGVFPHILSMTATPIPRTMVLSLYGELDLSVLDEMPKGRKAVKTYVVENHKRDDAYTWIKKELAHHDGQMFVVCPIIEESASETMKSVKAATVEYNNMQRIFKDLRVGLLHGRLKLSEKDELMKLFSQRRYDILVSTSLVEVGIDIPDATIIIIEAAERFGMSQLHQLRGRVGRSDKQSYCLLFTEHANPMVKKRLRYFATHTNGFDLAEYDLRHRGGGNIFGTKQHGVSDLALASITDQSLLTASSQAVKEFTDRGLQVAEYPELQRRLEKYKIKHISQN